MRLESGWPECYAIRMIPVAGGCVLSFGTPVWAVAYLPARAIALPRIERIASGLSNRGRNAARVLLSGRETPCIVTDSCTRVALRGARALRREPARTSMISLRMRPLRRSAPLPLFLLAFSRPPIHQEDRCRGRRRRPKRCQDADDPNGVAGFGADFLGAGFHVIVQLMSCSPRGAS